VSCWLDALGDFLQHSTDGVDFCLNLLGLVHEVVLDIELLIFGIHVLVTFAKSLLPLEV